MAFLSPLQNTFNKIYTDLKQMKSPVTISEKAAIEIRKILNSKNIPVDYGLRIGVKGGGCGVSFVLGFDKAKEDDITYDLDDIPVYVQKKQLMFLVGKGVDFYEGADARGFFSTKNYISSSTVARSQLPLIGGLCLLTETNTFSA